MASQEVGAAGVGLPASMVLISAGSVLAAVIVLAMCTCCKKSKVPHHKAKVMLNVVAEEEKKIYTPRSNRSESRRGRPPSVIFDGTPMTMGNWNDLTKIDETDIPDEFRRLQPKPERPLNPPDVIMHPALMYALKQQSQGRPQSTIVLRAPVSPGPVRSGPTPQPSASLEDLIREHEEEQDLKNPENELKRHPVDRDGGILYYRPKKEGVSAKPIHNLQQSRNLARGRIQSNEDHRSGTSVSKLRQATPSDPGDLRGLPQFDRLSGGWDNVPKPTLEDESPPSLPLRNYLADESDSNLGTNSAASGEYPDIVDKNPSVQRPRAGDQASVNKRAHHYENVQPRRPESNSQSRSPSPKRITQTTQWSGQHDHPGFPEFDNVFHGSETAEFVRNNSPQTVNRRAEYPNVPLRSDSSGHRQCGDAQDRPSYVDERQRRQNHRRANDHAQESVSPPNYDQNRKQLLPGSYLRPKPYYVYAGVLDHTKRFSDASDYSDLIYEGNPQCADRANRDYDPYGLKARWSMTPDLPPDGVFHGRQNSDFDIDEHYGYPRDRQQRRQLRRTHVHEERLDCNVTNGLPKKAEMDGIPSSGYHSLSSKNEETSDLSHQRKHRTHPALSRSSATPVNARTNLPQLQSSTPCAQRLATHPHVTYRFTPLQSMNCPPRIHRTSHQNAPSESVPVPLDVVHEQYYSEAPLDHDVSEQRTRSNDVTIEQNRHLRDVTREKYSNKSFPCHNTSFEQNVCSKHEKRPTVVTHPVDLESPSDLSTSSLSRQSSDYGSLIDVMYRYRKKVRKSRKKERPAESPESRLRFEREKLKDKLKETLEPGRWAAKNLDMVIETLLFLCETDITVDKRSTSRDHGNCKSRSRPISAIVSNDRGDAVYSSGSDVTKVSEDYAQIRSKSLESRMTSRTAGSITSVTDASEVTHHCRSMNSDVAIALGRDAKVIDVPQYSKINKTRRRRHHDYCEIKAHKSASVDSNGKEFAFPTEVELEDILSQRGDTLSRSPPPVPSRQYRSPIKPTWGAKHPYSSLRKNANLAQTSSPVILRYSPGRTTIRATSSDDKPLDVFPNEKKIIVDEDKPQTDRNESELSENAPLISTDAVSSDVKRARIGKQTNKKRRRSLPSMHLTESEVKWLEKLGGNVADLTARKKLSKFDQNRRNHKFNSARVRRKEPAEFLTLQDAASPEHQMVEKLTEEMITFDDIPVNDNTDAEDIIKEIERRMSNKTAKSTEIKTLQCDTVEKPVSYGSDMGTWGSVTSSDPQLTPPRREKLCRTGNTCSSTENSVSGSPVFVKNRLHSPLPDSKDRFHNPPPDPKNRFHTTLPNSKNRSHSPPPDFKNRFHTPPPDSKNHFHPPPSDSKDCFYTPPTESVRNTHSSLVPVHKEPLSPFSNYPVFETPPTTPKACESKPLTIPPHFSRPANMFHPANSPSAMASPRIQPQPPGPQFTPRKQPGHLHTPHKALLKPCASAPVSPVSGPKPVFSRRPSKHMAKLPFIGRRFVQSTSENLPVVAMETERRREARGGKIVILPADDEYADPFDCIHRDVTTASTNRDFPYSRFCSVTNTPHSQPAFSRLQGGKYYPVYDNDFDDYAVPINSPPSFLTKQRFLTRNRRNMPQNLETAV